MFCSGIDDNKLIYCAELHGIHSATVQDLSSVKLNDLKFTELKVQPKYPTRRHMNNFYRFKTRKWWSQLYLTKVRRIVLGLRSDSGIVDEVTFVDLKYLQKDYEVRNSKVDSLSINLSTIKSIRHGGEKGSCGSVLDKEGQLVTEKDAVARLLLGSICFCQSASRTKNQTLVRKMREEFR